MDFTNLGATGLKVSRICLGTMTYGSKKWRPWVLEEDESRPFIRRAIELGINFFDTADMYSLGVSEEIVGRALRDFGPGRERVVVQVRVAHRGIHRFGQRNTGVKAGQNKKNRLRRRKTCT